MHNQAKQPQNCWRRLPWHWIVHSWSARVLYGIYFDKFGELIFGYSDGEILCYPID